MNKLCQNTRIYRGSLITYHNLVPEDLLLILEPVIDQTQFGRFLIVRLNVPSIEEIKKHGGVNGQPFLCNLNFAFISF